jgi:hypothetical protein
MVTIPVPAAVVVTGGTSLAPDNVIPCPYNIGDIGAIDEQEANTAAAPAIATTRMRLRNIVFILFSLGKLACVTAESGNCGGYCLP